VRSELDSLYDKKLQSRTSVAYFVVVFVFGILCLRLWFLQIVEGNNYRKLSENNRIRIQEIPAPRGLILDSAGRVLAGNRPSFDICLVPQHTYNPEDVLKRLAKLLGCDLSRLKQRVERSRGRPPFESITLKSDVSRDTLAFVLTHRLDLPGIVVESTPARHYPFGTLACHLLGHMGEIDPRELARPDFALYKMGDFVGKSGVERAFELHLKGTDGGYQSEVNAVGYKINIMGQVNPVPAHNVVLTISADLQKTAEEALGNSVGSIVAVDPKSGRILAMASSPAFDPNAFSCGISPQGWEEIVNNPEHPLMNRCIQSAYPPGSTYKLVTAAAALEEELVEKDTEFFCAGSFRCGNRSYRCWKKHGHGKVALLKGVVESCDVYFYNLGTMLGPDLLAKCAKGFGFGLTTGIGIRNEKAGLIPTSSWYQGRYGIPWQAGESLSVAIGQGANQVTPLQLVMAYAAIANGGILYRPFHVDRIVSVDGKILKTFSPAVRGKLPVSKNNMSFLVGCLSGVVNSPAGTGRAARLSNVEVAGKTGTAQVVGVASGGVPPLADRFLDHAWFVAFAPKDDARVAVVVLVEHGGHGGSTAAPIAKTIISRFFDIAGGGNV